MSDDQLWRGIFFAGTIAALILYGVVYGTQVRDIPWSLRITMLGIGGLLTYQVAGQVKAFQLCIPFDRYSIFGLMAVTITVVSEIWFLREYLNNTRE